MYGADNKTLLSGQDWTTEIRKAIREADVVVVCLSKQFSQSAFVEGEVSFALEVAKQKSEGEFFIIPVRLETNVRFQKALRKWPTCRFVSR